MLIVGVDLGQANDYTAIAIIEKVINDAEPAYHVRKLERTRGISYLDIASKIASIMGKLPEDSRLVVDRSGVGQGIFDLLVDSNPVGITITGGAQVNQEGNTISCPKRDLIGNLQVLLESKRLKIAKGPLREVLLDELRNYRIKIDAASGHDSYNAKGANHDDILLAVALGCWWGARQPVDTDAWMPPEEPVMSGGIMDDLDRFERSYYGRR